MKRTLTRSPLLMTFAETTRWEENNSLKNSPVGMTGATEKGTESTEGTEGSEKERDGGYDAE